MKKEKIYEKVLPNGEIVYMNKEKNKKYLEKGDIIKKEKDGEEIYTKVKNKEIKKDGSVIIQYDKVNEN